MAFVKVTVTRQETPRNTLETAFIYFFTKEASYVRRLSYFSSHLSDSIVYLG